MLMSCISLCTIIVVHNITPSISDNVVSGSLYCLDVVIGEKDAFPSTLHFLKTAIIPVSVLWCDREFYYIQMEKYARQALAEGVKNASDLIVSTDSELYRVLVLHYNRNNQIEVCRYVWRFENIVSVFVCFTDHFSGRVEQSNGCVCVSFCVSER